MAAACSPVLSGAGKFQINKIMKPWIRKAHRWLGLIFSLTLLMSSGSGLLHIIMTRTQSAPPAARPTGRGMDVESIRVSAAEAVRSSLGEKAAAAVNLRMISGQPCYQIIPADPSALSYVNAVTGKVDASLDETYAREIVASHLGHDRLEKTDYLTDYNREYIPIFRILPVHRFDARDGKGTRVYVSTLTGSITRHTDDSKQTEASIFSLFHKFAFIPDKNLRDGILATVTGGVFLVSVLGVILFFATRPKIGSKSRNPTDFGSS